MTAFFAGVMPGRPDLGFFCFGDAAGAGTGAAAGAAAVVEEVVFGFFVFLGVEPSAAACTVASTNATSSAGKSERRMATAAAEI